MTSAATPTRVCFPLRVEETRLGHGGMLIGFHETDDDAASPAHLAAPPIAARWEAEIGPFFRGLHSRSDRAASLVTEIFHLEDQLAATAAPSPATDEESDPS